MSGRRYHIVGDHTIGFDNHVSQENAEAEAEADRQRMREIVEHERAVETASRSARIIPMHAAREPTPPDWHYERKDGTTRQIRGSLIGAKRLPNLEEVARSVGVPVAAVWSFVEGGDVDGSEVRGFATRDARDRRHVFLAVNLMPCALIRLGVLHHELRHQERGDVGWTRYSPFREADERKAEADCERSGERAVRDFVAVANIRAPHQANADACARCYREQARPCEQGREVYESVNRVLEVF